MDAAYCYLVVERHTYRSVVTSPEVQPKIQESVTSPVVRPNIRESLKRKLAFVIAETGPQGAPTSATPSRASHLDQIVAANLLLPEDVVELFPDRKIPDSAWSILGRIDPVKATSAAEAVPSGRDRVTYVRSWSLRLLTADETTSVDIDPHAFPQTSLPTRVILKALEDLAADGWTIVHVSEDREIDDAASKTTIVGQRILLTR